MHVTSTLRLFSSQDYLGTNLAMLCIQSSIFVPCRREMGAIPPRIGGRALLVGSATPDENNIAL